jgi:polyhydroxyalkanoate synthesis regulator protein
MESMFIALKEDTKLELKAIDTEKRILLGAVLIQISLSTETKTGKNLISYFLLKLYF